jgi:hypothetical protein
MRAGSILSQTACENRLPESTGRAEVTGLAARERFLRRISVSRREFSDCQNLVNEKNMQEKSTKNRNQKNLAGALR